MADAPNKPDEARELVHALWSTLYDIVSASKNMPTHLFKEASEVTARAKTFLLSTPSPPVAAPPATPVASPVGWALRNAVEVNTRWRQIARVRHDVEHEDHHYMAQWAYERGWADAAQPQPQPAQPLTADQRQDLLAAAFFIACRNEPGATLKDVDAERIAELLTDLSGFDLDSITAPSTPTPPSGVQE